MLRGYGGAGGRPSCGLGFQDVFSIFFPAGVLCYNNPNLSYFLSPFPFMIKPSLSQVSSPSSMNYSACFFFTKMKPLDKVIFMYTLSYDPFQLYLYVNFNSSVDTLVLSTMDINLLLDTNASSL